ncbi:MAG: hypothetical protein HGB20_10695 [Chlorobiaceae bacterium]|nr:hypothetical protein [Chlorobiaceae bacterium]
MGFSPVRAAKKSPGKTGAPLIAHCSSLIAHRSLLIAHCSLLIAHRSLLIAHCSSLIAQS